MQAAPTAIPQQLEGPVRSYVAQMRMDELPGTLAQLPRGPERRAAAFEAISAREQAVREALQPQLDDLRTSGLLSEYRFLPNTGTVVLRTPEERSGAAWEAIRGLEQLGTIVRDPGAEKVRNAGLVPGRSKANRSSRPPAIAPPHPELLPTGPAWSPAKVNAPQAWAAGARGEGVTIGFVDSGAQADHPAIADAWRGAREGTADHNFRDALADAREGLHDEWGHGTNTSSVAVGETPEGAQLGVAPDAEFISARVFGGKGTSLETMLDGMGWMVAPTKVDGSAPDPTKAPDVVNMSFGGRDQRALMYRTVLENFTAAGIVPVAAAGNGGRRGKGSILSPAMFPGVIAVGYTDRDDVVNKGSAHGPGKVTRPDGTLPFKPDVVAPGTKVDGALKGGGYGPLTGSSISSAVTSGVVALLLGRYPELTTEQVREALSSTAVDVGLPGRDAIAGHGRIDAAAALQRAAELLGKEPAAAAPAAAREGAEVAAAA